MNRHVATWWARARRPAPDSVLGLALAQGRPAWGELIHAMWSVWVFVVPMFSPYGYDLRWALLTLLSYPVFLALFCGALLWPRRRAPWCALAMIALCIVLLPWYVSGLSYFVFGCVFLGAVTRNALWRYLLMLAALNLLLVVWARWLGYPWTALAWMPVTTLVIGVLVHVERLKQSQDAALRLSHDEVRRLAAVAERERIGRDLHDLLGHTLAMVALKADLAAKLVDRDAAAAGREIGEVGDIARDALAQMRQAVSGIRAARIAAELAAARLLLETDGIGLDVAMAQDALGDDLAPEVECALALVLREAVTNVQRHARARRARIELARDDDGIRLRVVDDGRGGAMVPGTGIAGMRQRVAALGGRLQIDGRPGRTCLEAFVPVQGRPA
ncbi:two-component sensor histidine kinase [Lysobacteraceae bacterium NML93-0792]|nr:two-component sensor histidine kinase [Xanthomonadaceae bacterium NML93-0792]PBS14446.1 two-component sensor histidine kinase [Xanthomonadaceae bacterium NML93-0793]PBS18644.1 two-component sensor histidine kinase [Xanthomonadaceae bacterium NML93-0831]